MARHYLLDVITLVDNLAPYGTEPVTVSELKTYLQLEGAAYDGPLSIFIKAARKKIESFCNISLVPKSLHATFETYGSAGMPLPFPPYDALQKVEWRKCPSTWQLLVFDADYHIEDAEAGTAVIQSSECGKHRITWTTKPLIDINIFQQAIMAQAGYMYTHRDDASGWAAEAKALLEGERNLSF